MTIATDLGFKIGELYRVDGGCWTHGMIVEFVEDDGSSRPWFKYADGPSHRPIETDGDPIAISLSTLSPVEPTKASINKSLLQLYIEQQYPDDKMLKALVEAL